MRNTCVAIWLISGWTWSAAQDADSIGKSATGQPPATSEAKDSTSTADPAANELLTTARAEIDDYKTISADVVQTVSMGSRQFRATGHYAQADQDRIRVEFHVQFAIPGKGEARKSAKKKAESEAPNSATGKPDERDPTQSSMVQVSDGQVLWTEWNVGGESVVSRRDLQEIRRTLKAQPNISEDRLIVDLGLGGLKALLASLQDRMTFTTIREETVDGKAFTMIHGGWNTDARKQLAPAGTPDDAPLAGFIPDYVRIYFDDDKLPRRIMYLKRHPTEKLVKPMVTLDFVNIVLNGNLASDLFRYVPPDGVKTEDITSQVIQQLKQIQAGSSPPSSSPVEPGTPQ